MFNNDNKYSLIFFMGVLLQLVCILGTCISSLNNYNELHVILFKLLLVPNLLSYVFMGVGLIGLLGIASKSKK